MVISRDQRTGRSNILKLGNKSFERMEQFRYLEKPQTIKTVFRKKLRADSSQGMFVIIRCTTLCFPICYSNI